MSWTPEQPPASGGWQPGAQPPGPGGYPPAGPGGYPPPGYGGYTQQMQHPQGTTILVLGILSLVVCGLLGPFAWSMGNKALKEIDASGVVYANRGQVQAGRICGIVSSVLIILSIVLIILLLMAGVFLGTTSSSSFTQVGESISF